MLKRIINELDKIEQTENVKILYAVESGSRAWGFESKDSDFDVRFIYIRKKEDYLSIFEKRDVLEYPINDLLDLSGWDLKKALQLMYKSNPTLIEWLNSPIIYKSDQEFHKKMLSLSEEYFFPKACMYHYLNMAKQNYAKNFTDDKVKIKKYFYVLRPLFACNWIIEKNVIPPIEFNILYKDIKDSSIIEQIEILLEKKIKSNEYDLQNRNKILDDYIEQHINNFETYLKTLKDKNINEKKLNELFLYYIED